MSGAARAIIAFGAPSIMSPRCSLWYDAAKPWPSLLIKRSLMDAEHDGRNFDKEDAVCMLIIARQDQGLVAVVGEQASARICRSWRLPVFTCPSRVPRSHPQIL
jgi:hypothetical protein